MSQIEEYERPYNIVYGEDGAEQRVIPGPGGADFPLWRARQMVIAIISSQLSKTDDESEIEQFKNLRQQFRLATTGDLVFGMVRKFKNRKGKTRFVGVTPKGVDYREAGKGPRGTNDSRAAMFDADAGRGLPVSRPHRATSPAESDAERIARKMARAARKAVGPQEGAREDTNDG